ncbi:MAG: SMC-Scp complex subunit ScpB [Proteobacteria bacterium]|nr:SMC-Scp complex subunit ScpB [Pseudomonadota bacterium]
METNRIKSIIESILFVAEKPVTVDKLYEVFDKEVEKDIITSTLEEMKTVYDSEQNNGIKLEMAASGWQLRTKEDNQAWIKNMENIKPIRISTSALETLAIIAYKQPINKAEIDKIRGVDSTHLFKTLLERNLIRISGRSELPGKPLLYTTTPEFLEIFGLNDLNELPSINEIQELASKGFGDTGDYKQELNQSLRLIVEEKTDIEITEDVNTAEIDETLDKMTEIGKELRVDIDLVQEKVDIIFEEACRKYATQRQEIYKTTEGQ